MTTITGAATRAGASGLQPEDEQAAVSVAAVVALSQSSIVVAGGSVDSFVVATEGEHGAHLRTFMIADVRGYTTYTRSHGDEAAGDL